MKKNQFNIDPENSELSKKALEELAKDNSTYQILGNRIRGGLNWGKIVVEWGKGSPNT